MKTEIIKNCTLHNIDCMEYMKSLPDNAFDLAIVDPPYGIDAANMTMGKGSANDLGIHKKKNWDKAIPQKEYFDELFRISKNQIIWGGNYFLDYLGNTRCILIWDKLDYNSDFAAFEMAWTSFNKNCKTFQRARSAQGDATGKIHPTQKPVKLYEWLLTNYAKQGDKILDTHLGSGSHAIACNNLEFELVGCELDPDYFDAACKRIKQEAQQERLF
jgi:site-specific DNA-methyltransferase (adenine-specific)